MKTYIATLTFALAVSALPAVASAQGSSMAPTLVKGKTVDNCPHKASAKRDENRAQMREIASRLTQPRSQRQRSQGGRTVR